jgi:uncharacterized protein (DUF1810 family)
VRTEDPFDLERFVHAQDSVFEEVLLELQGGDKEGHWMWFIFPQMKGLGSSAMSQRSAISSRAEAEAYLAHAILGPRLIQCTELVNAVQGRSAERIFGSIDAVKFRSSMTLFREVSRPDSVFAEALRKYFAGEPDARTLKLLDSPRAAV